MVVRASTHLSLRACPYFVCAEFAVLTALPLLVDHRSNLPDRYHTRLSTSHKKKFPVHITSSHTILEQKRDRYKGDDRAPLTLESLPYHNIVPPTLQYICSFFIGITTYSRHACRIYAFRFTAVIFYPLQKRVLLFPRTD